MPMDYSLKPCPFCGGKAEMQTLYAPLHEYFVKCRKCGIEQKLYKSRRTATIAWNRRTADANGQKEVSDTLADHR